MLFVAWSSRTGSLHLPPVREYKAQYWNISETHAHTYTHTHTHRWITGEWTTHSSCNKPAMCNVLYLKGGENPCTWHQQLGMPFSMSTLRFPSPPSLCAIPCSPLQLASDCLLLKCFLLFEFNTTVQVYVCMCHHIRISVSCHIYSVILSLLEHTHTYIFSISQRCIVVATYLPSEKAGECVSRTNGCYDNRITQQWNNDM